MTLIYTLFGFPYKMTFYYTFKRVNPYLYAVYYFYMEN